MRIIPISNLNVGEPNRYIANVFTVTYDFT